MDIATIIGLISSLVTIEEAGRGWVSGLFHFCKKKRAKKKIVFVEWDAEDETTQRIIDIKQIVTIVHFRLLERFRNMMLFISFKEKFVQIKNPLIG